MAASAFGTKDEQIEALVTDAGSQPDCFQRSVLSNQSPQRFKRGRRIEAKSIGSQ
jgi:hypothetical protein